ncbi:unnamed protein product [Parnassius apollo]|uniref:Large ribosomal subunit protein mL38 n=1 Tax=Parnassius apollo TaxID=110799 RepID=A0A8S3WY59_PARAO|nr:unnamed protein product [Parnassius apollo]
MLSAFRRRFIPKIQFEQIRLGHRVRGKPPIFCRTIKERLDELNYKDELYTARIDIGFPSEKKPANILSARLEHLKKLKSDKQLEQLARNHKLEINLEEAKKEWLQTLGPKQKKQIADHYGNVIKPAEALEKPLVTYESNENSLWTLVLTNLDGHLTENDKEYVHWLVANIPSNSMEQGDTIVEYLHPFPLKGTGYHRYVFVLYKQNEKVSYDLQKVTLNSPLEDRTFYTRDWYQKYQDNITPVGLAFYQSDWDHTVKDYFHNVLNKKEPVYEYDFPPPYIRPQEWFPLRRPFNLYMDKYRDPKQINKEYLLRKLKNEDPFKRPPAPLRFPNAHPLPKEMPSWLKLHEKKIRLGWGRVNDV